MGEEPYFIDKITDYIAENLLDDGEKEFNQTIVYGSDVDVHALIGTAKRFPMMANHQVVIVKEAQKLKKIEELQSYVENPLESTILVLAHKYKNVDKRKAFYKAVNKKAVVYTSSPMRDYQVPEWINAYVAEKGFRINLPASRLLADYLGTDLGKIANELDKLSLILEQGTEINNEIIQKNIGISKDYNVFELQNALGNHNALKANQIINYFAANPKNNPLVMILSNLYGYFSKVMVLHYLEDKSDKSVAAELRIHPFFVKDYKRAANFYNAGKVAKIIANLREYDLKAKGVNNTSTSDSDLMRELVFKILH
jgi:DNA polymerase-3 subunit delta